MFATVALFVGSGSGTVLVVGVIDLFVTLFWTLSDEATTESEEAGFPIVELSVELTVEPNGFFRFLNFTIALLEAKAGETLERTQSTVRGSTKVYLLKLWVGGRDIVRFQMMFHAMLHTMFHASLQMVYANGLCKRRDALSFL